MSNAAENTEATPVYPADQPMAEIYKTDEGYFLRDLVTGKEEGPLVITDEHFLALQPNSSNRKWVKDNVVDKYLAEGHDTYPLVYKASKHFGPVGRRVPNEALLAYLSAEEADEVRALINKAYDAMEADKPVKPTTDKDKILARIAKLQKMLEELGDVE